jgi:predicted integral membrane protein DUF2269
MQASLVPLFLFLHVVGAIVAYGPTFAFSFIGAQSQKDPRHSHFGAVVSDMIVRRLVVPGAIAQGVTGLVLVFLIGVDFFSPAWRWLGVAIVLYLIAIAISLLYQAPAAARMVKLTAAAGPPRAVAGGPAPGPPPAIVENARRLQRGGILLSVLLVAIVALMVVKPTF